MARRNTRKAFERKHATQSSGQTCSVRVSAQPSGSVPCLVASETFSKQRPKTLLRRFWRLAATAAAVLELGCLAPTPRACATFLREELQSPASDDIKGVRHKHALGDKWTTDPERKRLKLTLRSHLTMSDGYSASEKANVAVQATCDNSTGHESCPVITIFDDGVVRLWQDALQPSWPPLVPLGLCPGEHRLSAWETTLSGSPVATATATFHIDHRKNTAWNATAPARGDTEPSNALETVGIRCNESELQPPYPGLHSDGKRLCRVCPASLDGLLADDSSAPFTMPPTAKKKRLSLRTSLRVSLRSDDEEKQRIEQEWDIELRRGESPALTARKFVVERLGIQRQRALNPRAGEHNGSRGHGADVQPEETAAESSGFLEEDRRERIVQWVTRKLETEVAEREARRSLVRVEAARLTSTMGELRVVLGAVPGRAATSSAGWLTTDVNTLDVTDAADFEELFGEAVDGDGIVDEFLAEHVWEHLSLDDAHRAARNCYRYLRPLGRLRLAVPDPAWFERQAANMASRTGCSRDTPAHTWPGSITHDVFDPLGDGQMGAKTDATGSNGFDVTLPKWLDVRMLAADIRDGHRIQFTPELLANVCWSSGLTPMLIEAGRGGHERNGLAMSEAASHLASRSTHKQHHRDPSRDESSSNAHDKGVPRSSVELPVAGLQREFRGEIKRSTAGGDPRGAFSIVMDCIKEGADDRQDVDSMPIKRDEALPEGQEQGGRENFVVSTADARAVLHVCSLRHEAATERLGPPAGQSDDPETTVAEADSREPHGDPALGGRPDLTRRWLRQDHVGNELSTNATSAMKGRKSQDDSRILERNEKNLAYQRGLDASGSMSSNCDAIVETKAPPCHGNDDRIARGQNRADPREGRSDFDVNFDYVGTSEIARHYPTEPSTLLVAGDTSGDDCAESRDDGDTANAKPRRERESSCQPHTEASFRACGREADRGAQDVRLRSCPAQLGDDIHLPCNEGDLNASRNSLLYGRVPAGVHPSPSELKARERERDVSLTSFGEWVCTARKHGRIDHPRAWKSVPEAPAESAMSDEGFISHASQAPRAAPGARTTPNPTAREMTMQDLKRYRTHAREMLLKGDAKTVLELCQTILQASPSDGTALLYRGVASAQQGDWDTAQAAMEQVLASSYGMQEHLSATTTYVGRPVRGTRSTAVPVDIALAAASNLASFSHARATDTRDTNAEVLLLMEGIRHAAGRMTRTQKPDSGNRVSFDGVHEHSGEAHGLVGALVMLARALRDQGQLTSALRLYQRAVLLGVNLDEDALHGLGDVSRRLRGLNHKKRLSTTTDEGDVHRGRISHECDWEIVHPKSGQMFSADDAIQVRLDVSRLDPCLPSAGIPLRAIAAGGDLGFIVCSYLDGFELSHCLSGGELRGLRPGWRTLTAEVFLLPSLRPLSRHDGNKEACSTRRVHFCVGDRNLCGAQERDEPAKPVSLSSDGLPGTPDLPGKTPSATPDSSGGTITDEDAGPMVADPTAKTTTVDIELPFCFMTLALNAMPFVLHHEPVFREVGSILAERAARTTSAAGADDTGSNSIEPATSSPEAFWRWYVVEGVAVGRADSRRPYSRRRIPSEYFDPVTGLSVDGTTEYLDSLIAAAPGGHSPRGGLPQVRVYRRCSEQGMGRERQSVGGGGDGGEAAPRASHHAYSEGHREGQWYDGDTDDEFSRGTNGCLWRDKIQMVNAVALSLEKECLLVQVDADELWTAAQLVELRDLFLRERSGASGHEGVHPSTPSVAEDGVPEAVSTGPAVKCGGVGEGRHEQIQDDAVMATREARTGGSDRGRQPHSKPASQQPSPRYRECAYFDCNFFVGPDLVTVTEDGWGHASSHEWLRAWVFRPLETLWLRHAPPELARYDATTGWRLLVDDACISREETRERGLVFTHYAYVLEEQVRFKSHFYGHSEVPEALCESIRDGGADGDNKTIADGVDEWRDLQDLPTPIRLADHLTWLRVKGRTEDPRLLTTIADRPGLDRRHHRRRAGRSGHEGGLLGTHASALFLDADRDFGRLPDLENLLRRLSDMNSSSRTGTRDVPAVSESGKGLAVPVVKETATSREDHDRGTDLRSATEGVRDTADAARVCGLLHLVVDGVVFQVQATRPLGMSRVWANVLPAMMDRLGDFEGTCLTFLVRGHTDPPRVVADTFAGRYPGRFRMMHVPTYNHLFGFAADRLLLSWAVRKARATAYVSTMYTQPFWATTPNVVRLVLIHDLLPETLGWDMSYGEWAEKANAIALASSIVTVSEHSAAEFARVYPPENVTRWPAAGNASCLDGDRIVPRPPSVWASHNGVNTTVFRTVADDDRVDTARMNVDAFRKAAGLARDTPYVMIVGSRLGYKNALAAYRALALASSSLALVLVGGGPITREEMEWLDEVQSWSHIGTGADTKGEPLPFQAQAPPNEAVDDNLLAAGYAGAVALLHLSLAEGFGLTVLEAFACGCPVVAADIPSIREIAGLAKQRGVPVAKAPNKGTSGGPVEGSPAEALRGTTPETSSPAPAWISECGPRAGAPAHVQHAAGKVENSIVVSICEGREPTVSLLQGGLVLIEDPESATQIWRAVRSLAGLDADRRGVIRDTLVRRAQGFDSWQPLADTLIKAAAESECA